MDLVEAYVNASNLQFRDALDVVEEFSFEISEMRGKSMDVGCGPGEVTKKLILPRLPADAEIVGTDISESMIEYARRKYQDEKRLSFLQLDIETAVLPSEDVEQFDNILSFYCLHWCQNSWRAFENIYKLLKPGGKALVMFLASNDGFDAYLKIHENPRYRPYMQDASRFVPYFHRCKDPRAALREILQDVGFRILHCSKREKSFVYQNLQNLRDHLLAVNPFVSRIPQDLKEEFEEEILKEIASTKILLPSKENNGQQECSLLDRYYILVAYVTKPQT